MNTSLWCTYIWCTHIMEDDSENPIAYMSRTLNAAERNYSQIEKAIVSVVKRFHQYLYGRKFSMVTDHKPLLGLLPNTFNLRCTYTKLGTTITFV